MSTADLINKILTREGGWWLDPVGGPTNFGITTHVYKPYCLAKNIPYNSSDIRKLTKEGAFQIYVWLFQQYRLDNIENVDLQDLLFDCAVNHGPDDGIKWAQKALGLKVDGVCGPITTAAINKSPQLVYNEVLKQRIVYYGLLTQQNPADNVKNIKGWLQRAVQFIKGEI